MTTNERQHLAALKKRLAVLQTRIAANPKADFLGDEKREAKALVWAIGVLETAERLGVTVQEVLASSMELIEAHEANRSSAGLRLGGASVEDFNRHGNKL